MVILPGRGLRRLGGIDARGWEETGGPARRTLPSSSRVAGCHCSGAGLFFPYGAGSYDVGPRFE